MNERDPVPRLLPVAIVSGMQLFPVDDIAPATVEGITQEYCIHRLEGTLAVSRWRNLAVSVCPARPLLPTDIAENDRRNAAATVLRELLALQPFGFTAAQQQAFEELVATLTAGP